MALDYLYPTHDQAVLALLNAILTHHEIVNSQIFYPVVIGEVPQTEPIRIVSARDFGGLELIEPGLTLAVYPSYGVFNQKSPTFLKKESGLKSVVYKDKYLGRAGDTNYGVESRFSFVVQLFYQDASLNAPVQLLSDLITDSPDFNPLYVPAAKRVQYKDASLPTDITTLEEFIDNEDAVISPSTLGNNVNLTILTLPAERILRAWMSLLVKVIRSLVVIRPFAIKNPTVEYVDYPTSNWLKDSPNLIFHTSYLVVTYETVEPVGDGSFIFPNPTSVNIST
jgi:hypothetical protein